MRVIPIRTDKPERPRDDAQGLELHRLLLGDLPHDLPLPPLPDVLSALLTLADGSREKSILPLGTAPAELVLVRRGSRVLVSYVVVDGAPELRALDRPLPLETLLARCADLAEIAARSESDPSARSLTLRLAERARTTELREPAEAAPVHRSGGTLSAPSMRTPLAFGFDASIVPLADPPRQAGEHSDVHALLFRGSLFMWVRGRRIGLVRGPVMLAIQRMVVAVRALVEAWEASRALHVRLRAGAFVVAVRLPRNGSVQLTLGSEDEGQVTIPELRIDEAALPILRLASEVLRALVSVDRAQTRNLRVASLRDEVRSLRRRVKSLGPRVESVLHGDPERLRASSAAAREPEPVEPPLSARALRFDQRWHTEVEGLDAASTFLCGDRIVVATPRQIVAVARDGGHTLWARREPAAASFMTGTVLVRVSGDGRVSLCDPIDGEPFAQARITPRVGPPCGILAGGGPIPPVAVLGEGRGRLVAVDLRTAELRWRFATPGPGSFVLTRSGRILLCVRGDGTLSALDVANGELLWRVAIDGRFTLAPAIHGDRVIAVSGACGDEEAELHAIDLFSGRTLWQRTLDRPLLSAPLAGADTVAIALGAPRGAQLCGFSLEDGERSWSAPDPGAALGGAALAIDRTLIVNGPLGHAAAIDLDNGEAQWRRRLAHPVADDVPRRLEPVLRGGALFVPAAQVHVLRPHDGSSIADAISCDLVPDWMRVDERGWIYVAEESGHLSAFAPRPQLTLVR